MCCGWRWLVQEESAEQGQRWRAWRFLTASLLLMPWTTYDSGTTAAPLRHRPSAGTSPVSQQGGLPRLESGAPKSSATFLSLPELSGLEAPGDAEGRWSLDGSQ
jgi:hypothetical protein